MKTGNDGTECVEKKQRAHSILPLPHPALIRKHTATQNGHIAGTQPIRESNGSDGRQPTFSNFACWIGADNVHAAPESFQHSWTHWTNLFPTYKSLPKRFRHPTVGPVCSCLKTCWRGCKCMRMFGCQWLIVFSDEVTADGSSRTKCIHLFCSDQTDVLNLCRQRHHKASAPQFKHSKWCSELTSGRFIGFIH